MKVLVTGGAGFIGSHVVDRLRAAGHEARIFDVRRSPYLEHRAVETVVGDLLDPRDVRRAAEGCDAIAHLAASADVGIVAKEPEEAEELNARGTLNVLQAARDTGAHVIYASTIWVYSDVVADEVDEDTPLRLPAHLYTATKLAGEMYCRSYAELYDVRSTVLRFGIPYGPRARPAAVIPAFVNKALAGEPLSIAGDGSQSRRFVYVEDLAEGVVRALRPQAVGRTYNLVGDEDTSIREIADAVRNAVGPVEIVHTEGRAGDFAGARVCGSRAAAELGWTATTPFAEGVAHYVAWQRRQTEAAPAGAGVGVAVRNGLAQRTRRTAGLALAAVVAVLSYLYAVESIGLGDDGVRTVALISVVAALMASVGQQTRLSRLAWPVAVLVGVLLLIPRSAHALHLENLDLPLALLGAVGAGLALFTLDAGERIARQVGEPSQQRS